MFGRTRIDAAALVARAFSACADPRDRLQSMCGALTSHLEVELAAYYVRDSAGFLLDYLHLRSATPEVRGSAGGRVSESANERPRPGVGGVMRGATLERPANVVSEPVNDVHYERVAPPTLVAQPSLREPCVWAEGGHCMVWLPFEGAGLLLGPFDRARAARRALDAVAPARDVAAALFRSVGEQVVLAAELRREKQVAASTSDVLASNLDVNSLLVALIQQAARSSRHAGAFVARRGANDWSVSASVGLPPTFQAAAQQRGIESLFELIELPETTLVQPRDEESQQAFGVRTLLLLPIGANDSLAGVFGLVNRTLVGEAKEDYEAMAGFAEQIALVVARERQLASFSEAYEDTLLTLCQGLDLARGCPGHHRRVARLARGIAARLGASLDEQQLVERAGLVHDVGLLPSSSTPDDVLVEFQHPTMGQTLVEPLPRGERLGSIIRQHHETWDGFGFPDTIGGAALDPMGQVLAVSEWIVERNTGNAIAPGVPADALAGELENREAGSRFEAELAASAAEVLRRGHLSVVEQGQNGG